MASELARLEDLPVFYVTEKHRAASPVVWEVIGPDGWATRTTQIDLELYRWLGAHARHRITSEQPIPFVRPYWRFEAHIV